MCKMSRNYYLEPVKIIRDLVHGYINLTEFDLKIIDTKEFQRLKDIRQLTCQNVYPSACHTRFEHSLGVLELTRQAIKNLNRNGVIVSKNEEFGGYINDNLSFNVSLAALLHDIGHCPFSHMGESEFDKEEVKRRLYEAASRKNERNLISSDLLSKIKRGKGIGAVHEQLSCIIILDNFDDMFSDAYIEDLDKELEINVDYELIIRCILGIEYDISTQKLFKENGIKNALVRLINSSVFDMDKLDYVMRDSLFTGIGTPNIDTGRLFRNMYFNREYNVVFTSRAVPALQNLIDARDGLYLYVYNHHAVIFSDFLNTYISRRLSHNTETFIELTSHGDIDNNSNFSKLGLIEKSHLFSVDAIVKAHRSDSDWVSLLNNIDANHKETRDEVEVALTKEINEQTQVKYDELSDRKERLIEKVLVAYKLIHNYKTRAFLKPWWKTVFEFTNFMRRNFPDDRIRSQLSDLICHGDGVRIEAAEFRSQIVKHVSYITQNYDNPDIIQPLKSEDIFIIERSNRFFSPDIIEKIEIALKANELSTSHGEKESKTGDYYIKKLTNIIPQKNYSSIYSKEGFYIFSKVFSRSKIAQEKHFRAIEKIFVFVATELICDGKQKFAELFCSEKNADKKLANEKASMDDMLERFRTFNRG